MLVCLEGILLVICRKFYCQIQQGKRSQNIVGCAQLARLLKRCDVGRDAKKEEDHILNRGYSIENILDSQKSGIRELTDES